MFHANNHSTSPHSLTRRLAHTGMSQGSLHRVSSHIADISVVYGNCFYFDCGMHCTENAPCVKVANHGLIRIPTYLINDPIANLKYQLIKHLFRILRIP